MSRAPKVGDYVCDGAAVYRDHRWRGTVRRVVRVTDATAWLDSGDTIKRRRSTLDGWRVTYVAPAEAERWLAARDAMKAWRKSIPDGARLVRAYHGDDVPEVDIPNRVDTAEEADRRAALYTAVAAWLRAKPDEDSLMIAVDRSDAP